MRPNSKLIASSIAAAICGVTMPAQAAGPFDPIEVDLTPDGSLVQDCNAAIRSGVMELERAGDHFMGLAMLKFTPKSFQLTTERPESIHTEPKYNGQVAYGKLTLGGEHARDHWVAIAVDDDENSWIYADLNADGDLTNDSQNGQWDTVYASDEKSNSYSTFNVFDIERVSDDGSLSTDEFGITIYWSYGTAQANLYRGAAAYGMASIEGEDVRVALIDEGHTGDYFTGFALEGGYEQSERTERRITLMLGGKSFDARGTINYNGMNYIPRTNVDGSKLILEPTPRIIEMPLSKAQQKTSQKKLITVGEKAPSFTAVTKDGETFDLDSLIGKKVIVLDFWATWCGPCIAAMPHLVEMNETATGEAFEIIALNVSDTEVSFKKYANANESDFGFPLVHDPVGRSDSLESISRKYYGVSALPTTVVIDLQGMIHYVQVGFIDEGKPLVASLNELGVHFEH